MSLGNRLYTGETSIDFVGRRRLWLTISAIAVVISLVALVKPGLNFGIDFKGGSLFEAEAHKPVTESAVLEAIGPVAKVVQVTSDDPPRVRVQTEALPADEVARVRSELGEVTGAEQVDTRSIGSKWGGTVSRRALLGLVVFLALVTLYVSIRFDLKMAVAALVAMLHDLILTAGIYALARFEVSPATVIALLTILGYSMYDTVVVFDKVKENTSGLSSVSKTTYSDLANRAVNQTAMRSLNTSLVSLLPVGALLFVGAFLLGAETLKDLSLALFVGIAVGTYSSMFLATPLLAAWKEREPRNQQLRARLARIQAAGPQATAAPASPGPAKTRRTRPVRQVAEQPEPMPMPQVAPDPDDDELVDAGEPEPAAASTHANRQRPAGQQQRRGNQQRRKGGQRPAKRRRR